MVRPPALPGYEKVKFMKGVPEGWQRKGLSSLGTYLNGYAFEPSDWGFEGIPIITSVRLKFEQIQLVIGKGLN